MAQEHGNMGAPSDMPARIEIYQDSPSARAQLVLFLERSFQGEGRCSAEQWQRRLAHWWDLNPFARDIVCRGWVLRKEDALVGFLGVIPACYDDAQGKTVPALMATSWAVDEPHRHAALPMILQFQRLSREYLLIDTTPSPPVQALLRRGGWTEEPEIRRQFLLRPLASRIMKDWANLLQPRQRVIQDPAEVKAVDRKEGSGCLQKHITPEYLRWYAASPMREHRFLGVVDGHGVLSSYLMVTPQTVRGMPAWTVVDWFTTAADSRELHALMEALTRQPGRWTPLLSVASFPPDETWGGLPHVHARTEQVCHFHLAPVHLKDQPKRTVPAEGDWGL